MSVPPAHRFALLRAGRFGGQGQAWRVYLISIAFVLFQFFLQLSAGEFIEQLMKSFKLSALGASVLTSTYYYIYVSLQTPGGFMMDRWGPRRLLSIGAFVCAFGCLLFAMAPHVWIAVLGRLCMGGGAAFAFVGCLALTGRWFPIQRFSAMVGLAEAIGMLGTIVGNVLLASALHHLGWRVAMVGAAFIAVFMGVLMIVFVQDHPGGEPQMPVHKSSVPWPSRSDFSALFKNPLAWVNGVVSCLLFSVVTVFVALWGIPFIKLAHGVSLVQAALTVNAVFLGVAMGSPVMGWIDQHFMARREWMLAGAIITFGLLLVIIFDIHASLPWVAVQMFILGMGVSVYVLTFTVGHEIVPPHLRATSLGFVNTWNVLAAPLIQPLIGGILHLLNQGAKSGEEVYSVHEYQMALLILPALVLVAVFLIRKLPLRIPHEN